MPLTHLIYGGTFDPPHTAHRTCVLSARSKYPEAQILVVPGKSPAGVVGHHKSPGASHEQRLAMCRLAFAGITGCVVSDIEAGLPTPNWTINSLRALRKVHGPTAKFGLIVGEDQLAAFDRWREPLAILAEASLVVCARNSSDSLKAQIEALLGRLSRLKSDSNVSAVIEGSNEIEILASAVHPANSSDIREAIGKGSPVPEGWLDPSVKEYMNQAKLYRH